jgi:ribonucleotide reductase alpha subunit
MLVISANILHPFWKMRSYRKWDKRMDFNPEDETSYTTQYQEAFLQYVEIEYCAKHRSMLVDKLESLWIRTLVPSPMDSGSGQSSFDPYDLSSDDE